MSVEANKAQTRQIVDQAWNKGNIDALDELMSADFVYHTTFNAVETRDGFKQRVQMLRAAFPDLEVKVEEMLGEGDKVVTRARVRGTHLGPFRGIPATGKKVEWSVIAIDRVVDGKRVEGWSQHDIVGLLEQLGAKMVVE